MWNISGIKNSTAYKAPENKKQANKVWRSIRQDFDNYDYAFWNGLDFTPSGKKHIPRRNKKERIEEFLNYGNPNWWKDRPRTLRQYECIKHISDTDPSRAYGCSKSNTSRFEMYVDFDCQKALTLYKLKKNKREAKRFYNIVQSDFNAFYQKESERYETYPLKNPSFFTKLENSSTSGYCSRARLEGLDLTAEEACELYDHFDKWLKGLFIKHKIQIKGVECLGHPQIRKFNENTKEVEIEKMGRLCLLPKNLDYQNVDLLNPNIIKNLPVPKEEEILVSKTTGSLSLSFKEKETKWIKRHGLNVAFQNARYLLARQTLAPAGRVITRLIDYQIGQIVIALLKQYKNSNNGTPQKRVIHFWNLICKILGIERAFDDRRWKSIRDTLVDCKFINMIDNTYCFRRCLIPGKKPQKGWCMKWHVDDEWSIYLQRDNRTISSRTIVVFPIYIPYICRPERVTHPEDEPNWHCDPDNLEILTFEEQMAIN